MISLVLPESIGLRLKERGQRHEMPGPRRLQSLGYSLACLLLVQVSAGCSSSAGPDNAQPVVVPPPPPPPVVTSSTHGHYRGVVINGAEKFHSDMILTADGEFRIYVGGPVNWNDDSLSGAGITGELLDPASSTQIFGHVGGDGNERLGRGRIVAEICTAQAPVRFCGQTTEVEIEIEKTSRGHLAGEIRIPTEAGNEIWSLDVANWSIYYRSHASPPYAAGSFVEKLAPFTQDDDVIVTIDAAGKLFFQDAGSGCTGNGTLTPHLDGGFYVFDVVLSIGNCSADFDYLNSDDYVGLATETQNNYWGYDAWLLLIVAAPGWERPAAITMYAGRF